VRKTKTLGIKKAIRACAPPNGLRALLKLEGKLRGEGDLDALRKRTPRKR
jgi:hypothetical protein